MGTYLEDLFSLSGKTALITGGSSGIGRMIAETLYQAGARVFVASRKREACQVVADEINALTGTGHVEGFAGNLETEHGILALAAAVRERTDRLDILVNNAGRTWGASLESFPYDAWQRVLSVNLTAAFALTQHLLPLLSAAATPENPARVVNLGSVTGTVPLGNNAYAYASSKAAIHHLTRILANELAPSNITVNAFAPGPIETRMTAFATSDPVLRQKLVATVPLGRLGRPSDIAAATLYVCGPGGSYVTGAVLPIDGGKHIAVAPNAYSEE